MDTGTITLDKTAMGLSGLCVLHCLALPLIAAGMPVLAGVAEAEWVHQLFVVLAVPVTLMVILRSGEMPVRSQIIFAGVGVIGLLFLTAAAFAEALHDWEVTLTLIGAVLLAAAHFRRWREIEAMDELIP